MLFKRYNRKTMRVAVDIDHTAVLTDVKPTPSVISGEHNPYLNPVFNGYRYLLLDFITGRSFIRRSETLELLRHIGLYPRSVLMNPTENYSQDWIATFKAALLYEGEYDIYIEDNPEYRRVMKDYWTGDITSSKDFVAYLMGEIETL